jgi:hypothetical protein
MRAFGLHAGRLIQASLAFAGAASTWAARR